MALPIPPIQWAVYQDAGGHKLVNLQAATDPADAVRFDQLTAGNSSYSPGVPGNWDAVIPTDVSDALDQLALRARELEFTYTTLYHVSAQHGNDSDNGLSQAKAFATLEAALNAGEAGAVPFGVYILDDSTYEVTAVAAGVRSTTVDMVLHAPLATIEGEAGGVVWKLRNSKIYGKEVNGTNLTFSPQFSTGTHEHTWLKITDQSTLYQVLSTDVDKSRWNVFANRYFSVGEICRIEKWAFFSFISHEGAGTFNTANTEAVFRGDGANIFLHVSVQNLDGNNTGAGQGYAMYLDNGAVGFLHGQCKTNNIHGAYVDNGSEVYTFLSGVNGEPAVYTNGGTGVIKAQSHAQGFDYQWLDSTPGLVLSDLINIHDVSTGEQVSATLTQLQTLIGGGPGAGPVNTIVFGDSPYAASDGETILADASGGAITINLPAATSGAEIKVKKIDATANLITVDGNGAEQIDGALTADLDVQYESFTLKSDGSNWFIF